MISVPELLVVSEAPKWTDIALVFITLGLALFTGLLFNATRSMAGETKKLAEKTAEMAQRTAELAADTVAAARKTDLHHQQSLWPYVVIAPGGFDQHGVRFDIRNIGPGASPDIVVRCAEIDGIAAGGFLRVGPIGPGQIIGLGNEFLTVPYLDSTERANPQFIKEVKLDVEYGTLFGTQGVTRWKKQRGRNYATFEGYTPPKIINLGPDTSEA